LEDDEEEEEDEEEEDEDKDEEEEVAPTTPSKDAMRDEEGRLSVFEVSSDLEPEVRDDLPPLDPFFSLASLCFSWRARLSALDSLGFLVFSLLILFGFALANAAALAFFSAIFSSLADSGAEDDGVVAEGEAGTGAAEEATML
jgi:hypothetical protein